MTIKSDLKTEKNVMLLKVEIFKSCLKPFEKWLKGDEWNDAWFDRELSGLASVWCQLYELDLCAHLHVPNDDNWNFFIQIFIMSNSWPTRFSMSENSQKKCSL